MDKDISQAIQIWGGQREEALRVFARQMEQWGLVMPKVEPLVCDFGLGKFSEVGLIEYWIANEVEAGYCGKFLFVFDGQRCPEHHHEQKHETFFVVKGQVGMTVDGCERVMKEGDSLAMPPGQRHTFVGRGPALLLEASTPCLLEDNFFADAAIGKIVHDLPPS